MNLPFLKSQKPQKNFFLSLLYKPYKVSAILFEEINSKLFILSTSDQESTKNIDELSAEELLVLSDKVVTNVEPSLPEGATVEKTIFSVPYGWVEEGKITGDYLEKLKKVCQDLGLVPVGYLISIEAIISHLEHKEGAPVSAIFVEVAAKKIIVYLVRAGKILEVHSADIEKGVLPTVETLFKQFHKVDVLPSKIVLLDYKNASAMQQDFLSHTWPSDIAFLHLPQVIVLEKGVEDEAAVNGVAMQMDLEVLRDSNEIKEVEDETDKKTEETVDVQEAAEEVSGEEFGFMKEKDVAEEAVEQKSETEEALPVSDEKKTTSEEPNISFYKDDVSDQDVDPETRDVVKGLPLLSSIPLLSNFSLPATLKTLPGKIKMPNFKSIFSGTGNAMKIKLGVGIGVVIIAILLISFVYYGAILKANVAVFSDTKTINKTQDITFSEDPTSDSAIKIDVVDQEEKGDDSKSATGTKDTGESAKGTVLIYNKTESEKTFPKGTVVVGPNSLEFETQSDLKIASTSAFSTSLSSGSVKVTASKFGKEYNLPSGSNFTIKGSSSSNYIAKNSDAFSGGTKKTTTVVSQKDLDELLSQVEEKLEKQAVENAKQKLGGFDEVLPSAISSEVVEKNFTKKVGAEASSVEVSATIRYSIGKYNRDEFKKVLDNLSKGEVPSSYVIDEANSKINVSNIKIGKDNSATATLKVDALFAPKLDSAKLAEDIKGKSQTSAVEQIKSINGVTDVVINFTRKLPLFPDLLPRSTKNINIEVKK